jgi:hypothetical protein
VQDVDGASPTGAASTTEGTAGVGVAVSAGRSDLVQEVNDASPTGAALTGSAPTGDGTAGVGAGAAALVGAADGTVAEVMPAGIDVENDDTVLKSTELRLWESLGAGVPIAVVVGSVLLPLETGGFIAVVVGSVALPVGTGELEAVVEGSVLLPEDVAVVPG